MPNFTAPVGDMAKNEVHDVALLQGALLILKTHKRLSFWDGPVDGDWRRHQQSLTEALKKLEAKAKITNGPGRIEPGGQLTRALKQLLPPQYQSLSAIPGTACLTIQDPYGSQHKGPALKDLALHDQCRKDLERLIKAGADKLGLELVIDKEETDHKGRCVFTLKPHGVKCLDARLNPLAPGAPTPRPIIQAVSKHAAQATTLDVPPHGTKLEVKTRQAASSEADKYREKYYAEADKLVVESSQSLATAAIQDAWARGRYSKAIEASSKHYLALAKKGSDLDVWKQAAQDASDARNRKLLETRKQVSAIGAVRSSELKRTPPPFTKIVQKYAGDRPINTLSKSEAQEVFREIIKKSGTSNAIVNNAATTAGYVGKRIAILSAAIGMAEVVAAEDKVEEAGRQGAIFAGNSIGTVLASAAAVALGITALTGAAAIVAAFAVVIAGGIGGSILAEEIYDMLVD